MKKLLALLVLFVPVLSSCSVITVPEFYPWPFNANPGDRLDVIMEPTKGVENRCADMGGKLVYNELTLIFTCEGVDF